jgi:hypothetical protein
MVSGALDGQQVARIRGAVPAPNGSNEASAPDLHEHEPLAHRRLLGASRDSGHQLKLKLDGNEQVTYFARNDAGDFEATDEENVYPGTFQSYLGIATSANNMTSARAHLAHCRSTNIDSGHATQARMAPVG